MSDYDNTNTGALFKNDKEGNEKRPDYTGTVDVEGVVYNVSSWIRTSKGGVKFMSLVLEKKEGGAKKAAPKQQSIDEDIPF
jgi:hypothetical protein